MEGNEEFAERLKGYIIRFDVRLLSKNVRDHSFFGEFIVEANSDISAIREAEERIFKIRHIFYDGEGYRIQKEIKFEDGWHFFNDEYNIEATPRCESGLEYISKERNCFLLNV